MKIKLVSISVISTSLNQGSVKDQLKVNCGEKNNKISHMVHISLELYIFEKSG